MGDAGDLELLEAWRGGDRKLGNALFKRHARMVQRFFRTKLSTGVDDLVQATFLAMVEKRDRLGPDSSFRAYLLGIARNQLLMHFERTARRGKTIDASQWSAVDLRGVPARAAALQRRSDLLVAALQRLPIDYQIAIELHYWEGMSTREVAEVADTTSGTIKSRLSRGRKLLAEHLEEIGPAGDLLATTLSDLEAHLKNMPSAIPSGRDGG